jgi:sec-independent protein translocase protein TatA
MFSGLESPMHLLVVLIIAMLVFGPKKLPELGHSLGKGIRGFKDSLEGKDENAAKAEAVAVEPPAEATVAQPSAESVGASPDQDAR